MAGSDLCTHMSAVGHGRRLLESEVLVKRLLLLVDMARQTLPERHTIPIAQWTHVIRKDASGLSWGSRKENSIAI